jgi:HAD superfamily hydrolase (TIGR01450 family)
MKRTQSRSTADHDTTEHALDHVRCFLLDMDGTFYLGEALLPGALEFVGVLRRQGRDFLFLTNNSSRSQDDYAAKITRLGLPVDREKIFTSGEATARYMHGAFPDARVFLVGPPSLHAEFQAHGVALDESRPSHVVLGFDTTLTYAKLWRMCDLVRAGLPYVATHADFNCPTPSGYMPDVGAMIALVRASTGREPDLVVGKPNRMFVEAAAAKLQLPVASLAMIGDRLYTDIALGKTSGIATILVLSGEMRREDAESSPHKPDLVFADLAEIAAYLRKDRDMA